MTNVKVFSGSNTLIGLKVQAASDASGDFVPVFALDTESITIGGVTLPNLEGSIGAGTAPAKMTVSGLVYNTAAPTPTNGQTLALQGDSSGNLKTNVSVALPAGQNSLGNVGGKTVSVTVTPIVTASNSYGVNYVVGGLLTFNNAFTSTGSGIIQSVIVTIKKVETSGFTFFPFSVNPTNTTWTDAAVAAINASDVASVRSPISLTGNSQLGTHTVAYATGLGQSMAVGSTTLYGVLIANAALTNQFSSTSDVTVTVKIIQDV